MAEIGISNSTDDNSSVIKKWDSINLFIAALALAADSVVSYAGDLSDLKGGVRALGLGILTLLIFDYRIAKRLVDVFKIRHASSSTIFWLKLNVVAVVALGVLNCINFITNIFSIDLESFMVTTVGLAGSVFFGICGLIFVCTQTYVIVQLYRIGQKELSISIIVFTLIDIIFTLSFDGKHVPGADFLIGTILNVIFGLIMYYQYNAFFGKDTEGWDTLDNIF